MSTARNLNIGHFHLKLIFSNMNAILGTTSSTQSQNTLNYWRLDHQSYDQY